MKLLLVFYQLQKRRKKEGDKMPPEEFAMWLVGWLVVALSSSMFFSAQSSDPPKVFVLTSAISCIIFILLVAIWAACYAIAWLWKNPTVVGILAICGFLIYLKFRPDALPQGEKK